MSAFERINQLIKRPKHAFNQFETHPVSAWFPFILICATVIVFNLGYYAYIDINWLYEHNIQMIAGDLSPSEQEQIRHVFPSGESLKYNALIGGVVVLILQGAIIAALMNLLTKFDPENTDSFTDWLGVIWWTLLPVIPQLFIGLLVLLIIGSERIEQADLLITSLNQLVGLTPKDTLYSFVVGIDLFSLWSYVLLFYLICARTKLASSLCLTIALCPLLVELCIHLLMS
ncbi:YIP1 family protein [Catenovulum sp. SM1970]|uniref:YIP1 family protein n=1 Tax=Marinifaba aquimaris TaxID=2741323 RepID=UPI00157358E0|nr:YIP1 family protein [Marinifaba aquimaris]NTS78435.1 YIP1 family protein [Marinifaba aquimaris]